MTGLGREYGEGLYELARDEGLRDEIHDQLMQILDCVKAQPRFVHLLSSRAVERRERLKVVGDTFGGQAHAYVVYFMKLLVERERFDCFEDCVKWFHTRYNDDLGILEAQVTSAVALPQADIDAIRDKLQQLSGKRVAVHTQVDASLIGGVRVEMDGRRYDNSIKDRLARMKHSLAHSL